MGDGLFTLDSDYPVGPWPSSVFAGDLDGDGDLDLTTAHYPDDNVSVLLNDGDGTFAPDSVYSVGEEPVSVFAGDLDGDGDLDLATANYHSHNVSVLLNDGDGTFAPHSVYSVDLEPFSVFAGDLDGDGDLDLATANYFSDHVSVLLNNGDATFASHSVYSVGDGPRSVFAADLDGDGDLDLTTANRSSHRVSVLLNQKVVSVTMPIDQTGVDIAFVEDSDNLAILNFVTEDLDSVRITVHMGESPPDWPDEINWFNRYYSITPFPQGVSFEAALTVFYEQREFDLSGEVYETDLGIFRFVGGEWVLGYPGGGTVDPEENSITLDGVTEFSLWAIGPRTGAFLRSDADADMDVEMADAIFTLKALYVPGSPQPSCMDAADSDDNGAMEMSDALYTLKHLYVPGSPPPEPPFPDCGSDPTDDQLDCADHPCQGSM